MGEAVTHLTGLYRQMIADMCDVSWAPGDEALPVDLLERMYGSAIAEEQWRITCWVYLLTYGQQARPRAFDVTMTAFAGRIQDVFWRLGDVPTPMALAGIDNLPYAIQQRRGTYMLMRIGADMLRVVPRKLQQVLDAEPEGSPLRREAAARQRLGTATRAYNNGALLFENVLGAPQDMREREGDQYLSGHRWQRINRWADDPDTPRRLAEHVSLVKRLREDLREMPHYDAVTEEHVKALYNAIESETEPPTFGVNGIG